MKIINFPPGDIHLIFSIQKTQEGLEYDLLDE